MSWRDWFTSRHTQFLELQLRDTIIRYERELNEQRILHGREIDSLARVYTELKNAHAQQVSYVIQENAKLRDDLDRTRLFLTPALQSVQLRQDDSQPPPPSEVPTGTPWQRVLARELKAQEEQDKFRKETTASVNGVPSAVDGGNNGSSSP